MPDVIFSKGGPGAFPVVLAGWFYKIPILIHESDAIPGATNILSSHFATRIAITFEEAKRYFDPTRTATVGNPVRPWLIKDKPEPKVAKQLLGFNPEAPLTVILGGSQGSQRINEFIVANLPTILKETQLFHQTGTNNFSEIEALSKAAFPSATSYKVVAYITEELKNVLAAADCIVGRAGNGTISEAAAFGKPMILIPLPESANDHQRANAREFKKVGGGIIIEEANLLQEIFVSALKKILTDSSVKERMSAAATSFFKPTAAEVIAQEILLLGKN